MARDSLHCLPKCRVHVHRPRCLGRRHLDRVSLPGSRLATVGGVASHQSFQDNDENCNHLNKMHCSDQLHPLTELELVSEAVVDESSVFSSTLSSCDKKGLAKSLDMELLSSKNTLLPVATIPDEGPESSEDEDRCSDSGGVFEMSPADHLCPRTMHVTFVDTEGERRELSRTGYQASLSVPAAASDIVVSFSTSNGTSVVRVDRRDPGNQFIMDHDGEAVAERFHYIRCPAHVQYFLKGASPCCWVDQVDERKHTVSLPQLVSPDDDAQCAKVMHLSQRLPPAKVCLCQDSRELFQGEPDRVPPIGGIVNLTEPHSDFLLPEEVVLYEPTKGDVFARAEVWKPGNRQIFLNVPLLEEESVALRDFRELAAKRGVIASEVSPLPRYMETHALRFLQACKFNPVKAFDTMTTSFKERVQRLPIEEADVIRDLRTGFIYWHGRDRHCRPCLVLRLERLGELAKDKERAVRTVIFTLEYALRFAMAPGRVENWVVIIDLANVFSVISPLSIASMISTATAIAYALEKVYCGRMVWLKIVNMPGGNGMLGRAINSTIPAEKKDKVSFPLDAAAALRTQFEPNQLESRYGGTAPDLEPHQTYPYNFFPDACKADGGQTQHQEGSLAECDAAVSEEVALLSSAWHPRATTRSEAKPSLLHESAALAFYEGALWDNSSDEVRDRWLQAATHSSLTPESCAALSIHGVEVEPCRELTAWLALAGPPPEGKELIGRLDQESSSVDVEIVNQESARVGIEIERSEINAESAMLAL